MEPEQVDERPVLTDAELADENELEEEDTDPADEVQPESEEAPDEPEPEAPVAPAPVSEFVPDPGETPDEAKLRELVDPDVHAALNAVINQRVNRALQSMGAAQVHITTTAAENPELFRVYGGKLNAFIAEQPAEIRGQKLGVNAAIARLVLEEAQASDAGTALRKISAMLGAAKPAAPKAPKAPIPAEQRPPSPSGVSRPAETGTRTERQFKRMGLSNRLIGDLMEDIRSGAH